MLWANLFIWWYGGGFLWRFKKQQNQLAGTADMFSIGLLLKTLFNPYRQISANEQSDSLPEQMRFLLDNLISRLVGFMVRSFMIVTGSIIMLFQIIFNCVVMLLHLIAPILPVAGLIVMLIGWLPL